LPHVLRFNAEAAPGAASRIAAALGVDDAAQGLFDLARLTNAPTSLREIGMPEDGIGPAVTEAMANPYWNPRPFAAIDIQTLILRAWNGEKP
jgi:maleylacetate reductase